MAKTSENTENKIAEKKPAFCFVIKRPKEKAQTIEIIVKISP